MAPVPDPQRILGRVLTRGRMRPSWIIRVLDDGNFRQFIYLSQMTGRSQPNIKAKFEPVTALPSAHKVRSSIGVRPDTLLSLLPGPIYLCRKWCRSHNLVFSRSNIRFLERTTVVNHRGVPEAPRASARRAVPYYGAYGDVPRNSLQGLLALKWSDLDWENLTLLLPRAVVGGHVDGVLQDACTARSCAGRVVVELEAKM